MLRREGRFSSNASVPPSPHAARLARRLDGFARVTPEASMQESRVQKIQQVSNRRASKWDQ
jgi:hypothetical protein